MATVLTRKRGRKKILQNNFPFWYKGDKDSSFGQHCWHWETASLLASKQRFKLPDIEESLIINCVLCSEIGNKPEFLDKVKCNSSRLIIDSVVCCCFLLACNSKKG